MMCMHKTTFFSGILLLLKIYGTEGGDIVYSLMGSYVY